MWLDFMISRWRYGVQIGNRQSWVDVAAMTSSGAANSKSLGSGLVPPSSTSEDVC